VKSGCPHHHNHEVKSDSNAGGGTPVGVKNVASLVQLRGISSIPGGHLPITPGGSTAGSSSGSVDFAERVETSDYSSCQISERPRLASSGCMVGLGDAKVSAESTSPTKINKNGNYFEPLKGSQGRGDPKWHSIFFKFVKDLGKMSSLFWLLSVVHALFLIVFHLFPNISGHYQSLKYGMSQEKAGYTSSLLSAFTIIGAPMVGLMIDRVGGQLYLVFFAAAITTTAYSLITFTREFNPLFSILMLSFSESVIPTILMALIPLSCPKSKYGIAFGIAEVLDAVGSIGGNFAMGYLKDKTQSYFIPMIGIIVASIVSLIIVFVLIVQDFNGQRNLNIAWNIHAPKDKRGLPIERSRSRRRRRERRKRGSGGGNNNVGEV